MREYKMTRTCIEILVSFIYHMTNSLRRLLALKFDNPLYILPWTTKSHALGDSSLIGLECESGDFSDCDLNRFNDHAPIGCEGILMFSNDNSTCGSMCDSNRAKRSSESNGFKKQGWTPYYISEDLPINKDPKNPGTGDHEHFFFYSNSNRDKMKVYDSDGQAYTNCNKTAMDVRERNTHKHWWDLVNSNTLERMKCSDRI